MTQASTVQIAPLQADALWNAADGAVRAIPPVWPLASSVAVNPYLGQTGMDMATTAALLARVAGQPMTMPRAWFASRISDGRIREDDIRAALEAMPADQRPGDVAAIKAAASEPAPAPQALATVADLAARVTGTDWPGLIAERLGQWAAGYFDDGQAHWVAPKGKGAYGAWRSAASFDLTPEIAGLSGFAQHVSDAPANARDAITRAADRLGVTEAAAPTYFHALLMTLGGWAQVGRYTLWQAELAEGLDETGIDLLAIRLIWEEALLAQCDASLTEDWHETIAAHAAPVTASVDQTIDAVLQDAADRAGQRRLSLSFAQPAQAHDDARPAMQAAFCIDVRSEVYRRALESVDPAIETLGFAGFFGLTAAHRSFASDVVEKRLPVLLNAGVHSVSGSAGDAAAETEIRLSHRASRAWGRFKQAAVSSFAFVEAAGPIYAGKLVRDALGHATAQSDPDPAPRLDPALPLEAQIDAAQTILNAMSLTKDFARLVVVAGHGANVVNNPHASALHCGACGGYSGEVNARLLAGLLNSAEVRAGLADRGLEIPVDTLFVGGLHDTTTDDVTLYVKDTPSQAHSSDLKQARTWFAAAGKLSRSERALRLPRADDGADLPKRSHDWSETRPEWALAGCQAFVAAPRQRTKGKPLNGRAFLHDYAWQEDDGFGVLELIMTAPVVVASWISLQYYGSTVAPEAFGGGNKLLHNVTGGIGVVEGNGGILRAGLPMQSVHDGADFVHEPLRLSVCIEAPRDAMSDILARHDGVRALFDNGWLHLFALDENGQMAWRYVGDLKWEAVAVEVGDTPMRAAG